MDSEDRRKAKRAWWLVGLASVVLLIIGWFVPKWLGGTGEIKSANTCFSALSFFLWFLSFAMFCNWYACRKDRRIWGKVITGLTIILLVSSIVGYFFILRWQLGNMNSVAVICAVLTTLASFEVYLVGLNATSGNTNDNGKLTTFVFSLVTLLSLVSIAVTFANSAFFNLALTASYRRVIFLGAYCILPIIAYCLGFLAKIQGSHLAKVLTLAVSVVVEFTIGAIFVSLLVSNEFAFSALIPLFLAVGFAVALNEKKSFIK
jgi:hypothetical protein